MTILVVSTDGGDIAIQKHEMGDYIRGRALPAAPLASGLAATVRRRREGDAGVYLAMVPGRSRAEAWTAIGRFIRLEPPETAD